MKRIISPTITRVYLVPGGAMENGDSNVVIQLFSILTAQVNF